MSKWGEIVGVLHSCFWRFAQLQKTEGGGGGGIANLALEPRFASCLEEQEEFWVLDIASTSFIAF